MAGSRHYEGILAPSEKLARSTGPKIADLTPPVVKAVQCAKCGDLHRVDASTFVTIQGAIFVGLEGGVVDGTGAPVVFCRKIACLSEIVEAMVGKGKLTR